MGKYLQNQFRASQFLLKHNRPSDFCLSCWQRSSSCVPQLCVRVIIFLACLFTIILSIVIWPYPIGYWFTYLTNWGIIMNAIASGFAVAVSLRVYLKGPLEPLPDLPWFVKAFWALYDIAVLMAFFITIYYFTLLRQDLEWIWDIVNDLLTHGVNSVLMLALLMTSRLPGRVLHFIYPVIFGLTYVFFSLAYYFAGGTSPFGDPFIYPFLNWEHPEVTILACVITAILLIIIHEIVVGMAEARNWMARSCRRTGPEALESMDKSTSTDTNQLVNSSAP